MENTSDICPRSTVFFFSKVEPELPSFDVYDLVVLNKFVVNYCHEYH